jgi:hypothetical protein
MIPAAQLEPGGSNLATGVLQGKRKGIRLAAGAQLPDNDAVLGKSLFPDAAPPGRGRIGDPAAPLGQSQEGFMFGIFGLGPAEIIVLGMLGAVVLVPVILVVVLIPLLSRRSEPGGGLSPLARIRRELPALTWEERWELRRLLDEPRAD